MLLKVLFAISILLNILLIAFFIYRFVIQWEYGSKGDYSGFDNHEFMRVASPDSLFDVVLDGESEGGAWEGYIYQAYVVERGAKPGPRTQFLEGTHMDSCVITWETNEVVRFHYQEGRILDFNSEVFMTYDKKKSRFIDIKLCTN